MARYQATIETAQPAEEVFAYLANFANAREWDPSVVDGQILTPGEPALGSRYEITAKFAGNSNVLEYEITDFEAPRRVVLRGENAGVVSIDTIIVARAGDVTRVSYDADLQFKGAYRALDPIFKLVFQRIGDKAKAGMQARLDAGDFE
ncbi:MAG: SRPBCC family protein [Thermoleophilaceae bacterium]|nr:SRPBCC family protein [Thermoleophilaceae bacterium]